MPSSAANFPRWPGLLRAIAARAIHASPLAALVVLLALVGLGDAASAAERGAIAAIALRPAAARLLAGARLAPIHRADEGFALATRAPAPAPASRFHAASRPMTARFPREAAGKIEIGVAGESRRVGVRRVAASAATGRIEAGALVYDAAAKGIDAVWLARGDDAEELLVVRGGAAAIAYDLELPEGSTLIAPPGFPGLVEVRDARGEAWLRMAADAAWDARGRAIAITARVTGSRVSIEVPDDAERPLVVDPTWSGAGRLAFGRAGHTATLLGSGQVLIAGGRADDDAKGMTAELYDPATGRFTAATTLMKAARAEHTATLLRSGQVLLVGGLNDPEETRTAEVFDPPSATFLAARSMPMARAEHTATLLADGRVLLVGGDAIGAKTTADLYGEVGSLALTVATPVRQRRRHTATLLADGRVLFLGGESAAARTTSEVFAPSAGTFTLGDVALVEPRAGHTTTTLRDGRLLVAGGDDGTKDDLTAELVDPLGHQATTTLLMNVARTGQTATLLPSGRVLLVGGEGELAGPSAELFDPAAEAFTTLDPPPRPRFGGHTATLLPSGEVLIVGGLASADGLDLGADAEIYDPHADVYPETAGPMGTTRVHHTATRLANGKVLVVGGSAVGKAVSVVDLYDRATDRFTPAGGATLSNRADHTATLLPSGAVLIVGGVGAGGAVLGTAAIYDPLTDRFHPTLGEMQVRRTHHASVALPSGQVLITGGSDENGDTTSLCELFDPVSQEFHATAGRMATARALHSATLLPSGEVLILGGTSSLDDGATVSDDSLGTAEIYDPITEELHAAGALVGPRPPIGASTATLLPSGEVLILGVGTPELYDPVSGKFRVNTNASGFEPALAGHTATLMPSGRVLIAGGAGGIDGNATFLPSPLIYAPASGEIFAPPIEGSTMRIFASATLLATGEVLIAGGNKSQDTKLANARRWSDTPDAAFRPRITRVPPRVIGGEMAQIGGDWGALGPDTGGGSTSASTANHPVAVWMPETGGAAVGGIAATTVDTAAWTAPNAGLSGRGLLFISADGATSDGVDLLVLQGFSCTSNLDCHAGLACSPEGRCVDPVTTGPPSSSCSASRSAPPTLTPLIAFLLGFAAIALRKGGRAAPRARCRAGRCSRRRRARRGPARRRA
ncbi:MAG: kelch repeat-containing protein [Byssovorax sp.]